MSASASLGLDAARAVDPARFAIRGATPRAALRPASREELAEALRAAAREALAVVPWGGGVTLAREAAPERYDVAIDVTALDRVLEYEPEDLTLTAEPGVRLATLSRLLAARGQELPLEAPHAGSATLGGVLASNASAARRLRFGAPRDRILGARFALSDGSLARSGGKVVKNVAGYGIHRLLCGSRGGLAVIVEASLKLTPAPALRAALIYPMSAGQIADRTRWARFTHLEPALLTVMGKSAAADLLSSAPPADFVVVLGVEDDAPGVERQVAMTMEALGEPALRRTSEDAIALWQALADLEEHDGARLSFATADRTPAVLAALLDDPVSARMVFHAPAGRLHVFPEPERAQSLASALAAQGLTLIGARDVPRIEPPIPPLAAVRQLRGRIRAALDPQRMLALGDRWEGGWS